DKDNLVVTLLPPVDTEGATVVTAKFLFGLQKKYTNQVLKEDATIGPIFKQAAGKNMLLAVVPGLAGKTNNAPLGLGGQGPSILGFAPEYQVPNSPLVAVTMDRFPSGDTTIFNKGRVLIRGAAAHEMGHLFKENPKDPESPSLLGDDYANG